MNGLAVNTAVSSFGSSVSNKISASIPSKEILLLLNDLETRLSTQESFKEESGIDREIIEIQERSIKKTISLLEKCQRYSPEIEKALSLSIAISKKIEERREKKELRGTDRMVYVEQRKGLWNFLRDRIFTIEVALGGMWFAFGIGGENGIALLCGVLLMFTGLFSKYQYRKLEQVREGIKRKEKRIQELRKEEEL